MPLSSTVDLKREKRLYILLDSERGLTVDALAEFGA